VPVEVFADIEAGEDGLPLLDSARDVMTLACFAPWALAGLSGEIEMYRSLAVARELAKIVTRLGETSLAFWQSIVHCSLMVTENHCPYRLQNARCLTRWQAQMTVDALRQR
jgi:hypothetical protein